MGSRVQGGWGEDVIGHGHRQARREAGKRRTRRALKSAVATQFLGGKMVMLEGPWVREGAGALIEVPVPRAAPALCWPSPRSHPSVIRGEGAMPAPPVDVMGPELAGGVVGKQGVHVVWYRSYDLRVHDHPPLHAAATDPAGIGVYPLYIEPNVQEEGGWPVTGAARLWQHHSLENLDINLRCAGARRLILKDARDNDLGTLGELLSLVDHLRRQHGPGVGITFHFNRLCSPWHVSRDAVIQEALVASGACVRTYKGVVLQEPWDAAINSHTCQRGFGSVGFFRRACEHLPPPGPPLPAPRGIKSAPAAMWPHSLSLADLGLAKMPRRKRTGEVRDWGGAMRSTWDMGESGGRRALRTFIDTGAVDDFEVKEVRFVAEADVTAKISAHIRFGELSAREVIHEVSKLGPQYHRQFLRRLVWRDLAYWCLWYFPHMASLPLRPWFDHQEWAAPTPKVKGMDAVCPLRAWQIGLTGYPLVDAAMRHLWAQGWIPNYMRHVVASFLVEYLGFDWRHGEAWFHDTLIDADVAINSFMWQNGGHSGLDHWNFVMHPGARLYPQRVVMDLAACRRRTHNWVLDVRRGPGKANILKSGHEWLPLPNGERAVMITRVDYREMSRTPLTYQTVAASWDKSKRAPLDPLGRILYDMKEKTKDNEEEDNL